MTHPTIREPVRKTSEQRINRKYYFIDNGILNLFFIDGNTSLLENIVAIILRRHYGVECYFWNSKNAEVDFYLPYVGIAIQVSYSLSDDDTEKREVGGLLNLATYQDVNRILVVTKDEERIIERDGHTIEIIPSWKWLLANN